MCNDMGEILQDLLPKKCNKIENPALIAKIKYSKSIIKQALDKWGPDKVALSFNGGKDCVVLLDMIHKIWEKRYSDENRDKIKYPSKPTLRALYFQNGDFFPEVTQFMDECAKLYKLNATIVTKKVKDGLSEQIEQHQIQAIFMGTRSTDPGASSLKSFSPTDPGWPQFIRINPILEWEYHEIWEYIRKLDIPYCPLYDRGFTSIGLQSDTLPNPHLKNPSSQHGYDPAYFLKDGSWERDGRR
eukprot:TRINITY_DN6042_c0_g1_i2.p1 TRINITY_DN6042_c0_g1~~TRINITY_DN6042_c0_g1_i2.p1  ORF type:complete len:243 (-),score=31.70 TRINITY_DN6042_c0_g1_i2:108-836(-)